MADKLKARSTLNNTEQEVENIAPDANLSKDELQAMYNAVQNKFSKYKETTRVMVNSLYKKMGEKDKEIDSLNIRIQDMEEEREEHHCDTNGRNHDNFFSVIQTSTPNKMHQMDSLMNELDLKEAQLKKLEGDLVNQREEFESELAETNMKVHELEDRILERAEQENNGEYVIKIQALEYTCKQLRDDYEKLDEELLQKEQQIAKLKEKLSNNDHNEQEIKLDENKIEQLQSERDSLEKEKQDLSNKAQSLEKEKEMLSDENNKYLEQINSLKMQKNDSSCKCTLI